MPALGPSEQLLKAVMGGAIEWKTFAKRYHDELFLDGPIDDRSETIKNHGQKSTLRLLRALGKKQNVTLLCHCVEDAKECHRFLLAKEIAKASDQAGADFRRRDLARVRLAGDAMPDRRDDAIDRVANRQRHPQTARAAHLHGARQARCTIRSAAVERR